MPRIVTRRERPAKSPRRASSIVLGTLLGLAILMAAGAGALAVFTPTSLVRDTLIDVVKRQTGRDLLVGGKVSVGFVPRFTATMHDVSLSSPAGMQGEPTVRLTALEASVGLWPFLKREIVIDRLVLRQPHFDLRIDGEGRRSWDFARRERRAEAGRPSVEFNPLLVPVGLVGKPQPVAAPDAVPALPSEVQDFIKHSSTGRAEATAELPGLLGAMRDLALSDVQVVGGSARFSDERTGRSEQIEHIELKLSLADLHAPLVSSGRLEWRGEAASFEGRLGSVFGLISAGSAPLKLKLNARLVESQFDGMLLTAGGTALDGRVSLASSAPRAFAAWAGTGLAEGAGLQAMSVSGQLRAGEAGGILDAATLVIDQTKATGTLALDLSAGRPQLKFALKIDRLDLTPYLTAMRLDSGPAEPGAGEAPAGSVKQRKSDAPPVGTGRIWLAASPSAPSDPPGAPGSIGDLIERATQPSDIAAARPATGPLQLAALAAAIDLDARLQVGRLTARELKFDRSQILAHLQGGVLRVNFEDVALYEGKGRGGVTLEPRGQGMALTLGITGDNLQAYPLLKDMLGYDRLSGRGRLTLSVTGSGNTGADLLQTLTGQAQIALTSGAIEGADLGALLKSVGRGDIAALGRRPSGKTEFSELAAGFSITSGIAETRDLRIASTVLTGTGAGAINLPRQQIELTVKAKLAPGEGVGGALAGIEVPVRLHGPLAAMKVTPQLNQLLGDSKVQAGVKELGKVLSTPEGAKQVGAALKKLLGPPQAGEPADQPAASPKDILNQLLKKKP